MCPLSGLFSNQAYTSTFSSCPEILEASKHSLPFLQELCVSQNFMYLHLKKKKTHTFAFLAISQY